MYSRLVEDTIKRNIIEEVPVFENKEEEHLWKCPFCDPESTAYRLNVPASSEVQELRRAKLLIKDHLELHKRDLLNQLATKRELTQYEKVRTWYIIRKGKKN
ncbi:hypothetical protein EDC94DRAFT_654606 [Helicostylum pulchrum]|nr:hypothetical protein EDC94DRAFT_654606 [Helicostylum pulchrum]